MAGFEEAAEEFDRYSTELGEIIDTPAERQWFAQMDTVSQTSAATAEELNAQASELDAMVGELQMLVVGNTRTTEVSKGKHSVGEQPHQTIPSRTNAFLGRGGAKKRTARHLHPSTPSHPDPVKLVTDDPETVLPLTDDDEVANF